MTQSNLISQLAGFNFISSKVLAAVPCQANALTTVLARNENGSGQCSHRLYLGSGAPTLALFPRIHLKHFVSKILVPDWLITSHVTPLRVGELRSTESLETPASTHHRLVLEAPAREEPTDTSKQPIKTRCLGHVTSYQPIKDQYFLIRSVPVPTTTTYCVPLNCTCDRRMPTWL
eukprot:sb/3472002/